MVNKPTNNMLNEPANQIENTMQSSHHKPSHQQRADRQRVVITGMGAVTPLGLDVASSWNNLIKGISGITTIRHFDATDYRSQISGTVKNFDITPYLSTKEAKRYDEFVHYGVAAASMALHHAGLITDISPELTPLQAVNPERMGVIIGSGIGGLQTLEDSTNTLSQKGVRRVSPFTLPASIINMTAGLTAIKFGIKGANLATATACTTSAHAIGLAARLIAYGDCDVMLAGGSEKGSSPVGMAGFANMGALSTRNDDPEQASRPFDNDRDGFVLGDGAGVLVLESLAHAKARGATILAELAGFGMSDDAHHITAPPADGNGAIRAMQLAINDAGVDPCEVGYINAHGTSTPAGDIAEALAIQTVFTDCAMQPFVSSTKSVTGHLLGAAGGVEAIFSILALTEQTLPPSVNLYQVDPACQLNHVMQTKTPPNPLCYALSNSFGFGGTNASLLFARYSA